MKRIFTVFGLLLMTAALTPAFAQDEITDDELKRYAMMESVIDEMKKDISRQVNTMIKNQEGMTGARYSELAKAKGDQAKYDAAGAKDFEIQFVELIDKIKKERIDAIKIVNQELATKMVGDNGKTYKKIKAALTSDEALKSRYEEIKGAINAD